MNELNSGEILAQTLVIMRNRCLNRVISHANRIPEPDRRAWATCTEEIQFQLEIGIFILGWLSRLLVVSRRVAPMSDEQQEKSRFEMLHH